ncbi:YceI family protein [Nonomuraea sp. NPDC059007]|uniref:YceI family protein n=1 Tax=Nonomuraea sp. NPDC059007 TaxID=3346692 RepID=UPI00369B5477
MSDIPEVKPGSWGIDAATARLTFRLSHLTLRTVSGRFNAFAGEIIVEPDLLRSSADAAIEMASIDTGDPERDAFLRSPAFFDVESFPEMRYRAEKVRSAARGLMADGALTVRQNIGALRLDVRWLEPEEVPGGGTRLFVSAMGRIDRHDVGVAIGSRLMDSRAVLGRTVRVSLTGHAVLRD